MKKNRRNYIALIYPAFYYHMFDSSPAIAYLRGFLIQKKIKSKSINFNKLLRYIENNSSNSFNNFAPSIFKSSSIAFLFTTHLLTPTMSFFWAYKSAVSVRQSRLSSFFILSNFSSIRLLLHHTIILVSLTQGFGFE